MSALLPAEVIARLERMRAHYAAEAEQETENLDFLSRQQSIGLTTQANLRAIIAKNEQDRDALDAAISAVQAQQPEHCLCAALLFSDGYIIRGHRHDDCIQTAIKLKREPGATQGFLTSRGRFVSREDGMALQVAAGIESRAGYRGDTLFSEDLY